MRAIHQIGSCGTNLGTDIALLRVCGHNSRKSVLFQYIYDTCSDNYISCQTQCIFPDLGDFFHPCGMALLSNGHLVIADQRNNRVQVQCSFFLIIFFFQFFNKLFGFS